MKRILWLAIIMASTEALATGVCLVCPPGFDCASGSPVVSGSGGQVLIREGASTTWKDVSTIALQGATGPQGATGVAGATGPQGGAGAVAGTTGAKALAATASAGTTTAGTAYAAWDHVHPLPTSSATPTTLGTAASAGSATTLSRSDHAHGYDPDKLYGHSGYCRNATTNSASFVDEINETSSKHCWCYKYKLDGSGLIIRRFWGAFNTVGECRALCAYSCVTD